jgi:hypothetical protein
VILEIPVQLVQLAILVQKVIPETKDQKVILVIPELLELLDHRE